MIQKTVSPIPGHVRVTFELPASVWADHVFLTGDFNDWNPHELPIRQDRDGVWRATLDLPAGQFYEFRYLIDGQWQTDYHADGFSSNNFGSYNSIVNASLPVVSLPETIGNRHTADASIGGTQRAHRSSMPQQPKHASRLTKLRPRTPSRTVA